MTKIKNLSNPIVILSLLGIILGLILIYLARNQSFDDGETSESIGMVGQTTEDVRLKRMGNMHWYVAEEKQNLYQGDLIFSGDKARTVLKLKDHGELILGPYSMVIIQSGFIQVESGEVELKADKPTIIKSFGEEIKVSANTSSTIIDRPQMKKIMLAQKDQQKAVNKKAQENLQKVIEKDKVIAEVKKKEIFDLGIEGLLPVWEPEKQKMPLTFVSKGRYDRVEITVKNDSFERKFEGSTQVELQDLPAGSYKLSGVGYYQGGLVSKSTEKELQVVIPLKAQKIDPPKLRHSKIKFFL